MMRFLAGVLAVGLALSPGAAAACSKLVHPFAEFESPLIVEATVTAVENGVAELQVHTALQQPDPPPAVPLRILNEQIGYDAGCQTRLGDPVFAVGERGFFMLTANDIDERAPWRPHGDHGIGLRLIRGERVFATQYQDGWVWVDAGTVDAFREQVRTGAPTLRRLEWEAQARQEEADCRSGDGPACRYRARVVGYTDPEAGVRYLRDACRVEAEGCAQLGLVLLKAKVHSEYESVPHEVADVSYLVNQACLEGDAGMCALRERAIAAGRRHTAQP